jgi:hypothetical protein
MDRSSGPKSIFPKGPNFTLEDFSNKDFIVRDFVDSLAESAMPSARRSGPSQSTTFDPKPLIRSFESMACDATPGARGPEQKWERWLTESFRRCLVSACRPWG